MSGRGKEAHTAFIITVLRGTNVYYVIEGQGGSFYKTNHYNKNTDFPKLQENLEETDHLVDDYI